MGVKNMLNVTFLLKQYQKYKPGEAQYNSIIPLLINTIESLTASSAASMTTSFFMSVMINLVQDNFRNLTLNKKLFKTDIDKYVSYYRINDKDNYATTTDIYHSISYTLEQYQLLMSYDYSINADKIVKLLDNVGDLYSDADTSDLDLNSVMNLADNYPEYLQFMNKLTVIGNSGGSEKIESLIAYIKQKSNENHVIYSNFMKNGINLLKKALTDAGIQYYYLDPQMTTKQFATTIAEFNKKKTNIMLLHPDLLEGFEIKEVRNFHIFEPVGVYGKLVQLKGRVNRYRSHINLPESERHITYHHWYCVFSKIKHPLYYAVEKKFNIDNMLTVVSRSPRADISAASFNLKTPDESLMRHTVLLEQFAQEIKTMFEE